MIKTKPLTLAQKLKNIVDLYEEADAAIDAQKLIQKGALDAGKENDGIEPGVVRKIIARRKRLAKDPAETARIEDLMTDYQFMLGEDREAVRPWTQADDEVSRVMALTNTSKPPKIDAIKKALGCSQGKAHKLRSLAAVRLAKSSSSSTQREHEHLPVHDSDGVVIAKPEDGDDGIQARNTHGMQSSDPAPQGTPMPVAPESVEVTSLAGPPVPEGGEGTGTHSEDAPASILPSPSAWRAVVAVRDEYEAAAEAIREAKREARRQELARRTKLAALTDSDMPDLPDFLDRRPQAQEAGV